MTAWRATRIFDAAAKASGVIPADARSSSAPVRAAVYSPALTDFVFMTENSYMFITGPNVVKAVMQEEVTLEELGGGLIHFHRKRRQPFPGEGRSGVPGDGALAARLSAVQQSGRPALRAAAGPRRSCPELEQMVPDNPNKPYDIKELILKVVDEGDFFEIQEAHAKNIVVGFGRVDGRTVGVVANQPMVLAGTIDIKASVKAAHFIRLCDAYNIPLVTLQDVPGFLPGTHQEYGGIIRNGARMIYAYSEATVPKLMVILRKSYGGAYCVMSSKGLRGDLLYAWPNAEIAVMGAEGAVNILFRKEVSEAADPEAKRRELTEEYQQRFNNPYIAAARGLIDDVIEPRDTRRVLIRALELTLSKRERHVPRKHGIAPM